MATATELNQIYLAYFGRPADPGGLAYFASMQLAQVIQTFNNSAESQALYGPTFGPAAVNAIYNNLFNRDASPAEAQAWVALINAPGSAGPAAAAFTILNNAANDDLVTVTHKEQVAAAFTAALDTPEEIAGYSGAAAAKAANEFIQLIDSSPISVAVANLLLDAQVAAVAAVGNRNSSGTPAPAPFPPATPAPAPAPAPVPSSAIMLTIGADTLTGTAGNDLFYADTLNDSNNQPASSLEDGDTLDGGAGNDTLEVSFGVAASPQPVLRNIENVVLHAHTPSVLYLGSSTGVTHATISNSSDTGYILDAFDATTVTVANQAVGAQFAGMRASTLGVELVNVGSAGNLAGVDIGAFGPSNATTVNITASNAHVLLADNGDSVATTLSVNATGSNELSLVDGSSTATTLSITGSGSVDLTGTDLAVLTTLSAAQATGAITIHLGASATSVATGAGNDKVSYIDAPAANAVVDLGAGDDVLALATAPVAGATLSGGAGNDSLQMDSATFAAISSFSSADKARISGFETLVITDAIGGGQVIDMAAFAGLKNVSTAGGVDGTVTPTALTIDHMQSGGTLTLGGPLTVGGVNANGQVVVNVLNAASGTADVLNIRFAPDVHSGGAYVEAEGVETLNIRSVTPDGLLSLGTSFFITDDALQTVTITGEDFVTLMPGATHFSHLTLVDASANTGGISMTLATNVSATGVTIKGSASYDIIALGNKTTVTGNGGSDAYYVGVPTTAQDFSTVTDMRVGDRLWFTGHGQNQDSYNSTQLALANGATLQNYLDTAAAGNGGSNAIVRWFQFGGDTYVVEDTSAAATFSNGADTVVRLTGLLDLSHSTVDQATRFTY